MLNPRSQPLPSHRFASVGAFNTLHPTAAAMLEVPTSDPWEVSLADQRRLFQRRLRDISGPVPSIRSIETLSAQPTGLGVGEGEGHQVPLTLYRPTLDRPLPLLMHIHGGGFVLGEHDHYHGLCARIANGAGCAVASVGYGLSPEHPFPQGLHDCQIAYEWLQSEADWLGLRPGQVVIGGDSAGGNLSAALGILATESLITPPLGLWLIYPLVDFLADTPSRDLLSQGYGLDRDLIEWFGQQYLSAGANEGEQILASPGRMGPEACASFPPSLLQTAGFDPLKDEARDLALRLDAAGRLLAYTCYEEMTHGFINAFDLLAEAQMAVDEGTLWLRRLFSND